MVLLIENVTYITKLAIEELEKSDKTAVPA
jgi:hypothetical protein